MNNNNVLEEFFVWEENNSTDLNQNSLKNAEQDNSVTTIETETDSTPKDWRDITDPKLRRKMRNKAWYEANKHKAKKRNEELKNNQEIQNKIKEQRKKHYSKNRELIRERQKIAHKKHYEVNKDKIQAAHRDYNELNKDKIKKQRQEYYERNKRKILDYNQSYHNDKLKSNTQYRLAYILRCRLRTALNKKYKAGHAVKDLGCSISELKIYLEFKFQVGMSWENHSQTGWHIDHIKPLSHFDLSDRDQFLQACHYTNLQPLWAKDNLTKSDNYSEDLDLMN